MHPLNVGHSGCEHDFGGPRAYIRQKGPCVEDRTDGRYVRKMISRPNEIVSKFVGLDAVLDCFRCDRTSRAE